MSLEERAKFRKKQSHENFLEMLRYLNEYKQKVCFDSQGVVAMIKNKGNPKNEAEAEEMEEMMEMYCSENLFPRQKDGPN